MEFSYPKLTESEWCYLAGLIDGRGTINIEASRKKNGDVSFRRFVSINNADQLLVNWCYSRLPVGSQNVSKTGRAVKIRWSSGTAEYILANVKDRLVSKKNQAEIALSMPPENQDEQLLSWKSLRGTKQRDKRFSQTPPDIAREQEEFQLSLLEDLI